MALAIVLAAPPAALFAWWFVGGVRARLTRRRNIRKLARVLDRRAF